LPNFYFHCTTAYDILRHCGIELGKRDFMARRSRCSARLGWMEFAQHPFVPARGTPRRSRRGDPVAGTQIASREQVALDSRLRGNERKRGRSVVAVRAVRAEAFAVTPPRPRAAVRARGPDAPSRPAATPARGRDKDRPPAWCRA